MTYFIDVQRVSVSYAEEDSTTRTILNDISLHIRRGELVTVVGPSGCGKSTLLRLLLGAQFPTTGSVLIDGNPVKRIGPDCGIVYQSYSLFPHLSVLDNICFGLMLARTNLYQAIFAAPLVFAEDMVRAHQRRVGIGKRSNDSAEIDPACNSAGKTTTAQQSLLDMHAWSSRILDCFSYTRARRQAREAAYEFLADIGLERSDADKFPHELSGGMRQRVAIAQAVIMQPKLLLMDEPFGALDHARREEMQDFIHDQWQKHQLTVLFVTHDLDEAVKLGTRLICLSQYWTDENNQPARGSKIVVDRKVLGGDIKPSTFRDSSEFKSLISQIGEEGLSAQHCHLLRDFDLSHPDAMHNGQGGTGS